MNLTTEDVRLLVKMIQEKIIDKDIELSKEEDILIAKIGLIEENCNLQEEVNAKIIDLQGRMKNLNEKSREEK